MKKFLLSLLVTLALAIPSSPAWSACAFLCNDGKGNGTFGANLTVVGTLTAGAFNFGTPGAAGTILRSNGTGWVTSQDTWPDLIGSGNVLFATAANTVGSDNGFTYASNVLTAHTATVSTGALTVTTGAIVPNQTAGITGTTTNNNANAGAVGEVVSSDVACNAVSLTSSVVANATSISLTAGDWDVSGKVCVITAATTNVVSAIAGITTTSATLPGESNFSNIVVNPAAGLVYGTQTLRGLSPTVRISISGTTTVYLIAAGSFTVSTLDAGGTILARRVR